MNFRILALALALTGLPLAAAAQSAPPPGPPALTQAQRTALQQTMHTYMTREQQLHAQMRDRVLGALSPLHRTAVANIVGQLAIAAKPNHAAAIAEIDRLLTVNEKRAILSADASLRAQSQSLHAQMRAQLATVLPARPHPAMDKAHAWMHGNAQLRNDPGAILLRTLGGRGHGMPFMMHHPMR